MHTMNEYAIIKSQLSAGQAHTKFGKYYIYYSNAHTMEQNNNYCYYTITRHAHALVQYILDTVSR